MPRIHTAILASMSPLSALSAVSALLAAGLLTACQTTPSPGREIRARVHEVPLTREALAQGARQSGLHAAVRAGATVADAAAGRLVLAGCALPPFGPTPEGQARLYTVSTVLPTGMVLAPGAVLQLQAEPGAFATEPVGGRWPAVHAPFVGVVAAGVPLDDRTGVPWRLRPTDPLQQRVRCLPVGAEPGRVQVAFFRTVRADELRDAAAEVARRALFSDAELAAGRVLHVVCRLRVADGGEWHAPQFLALAPAGLAARVGDTVRLRAGAAETSSAGGPIGQVLAREANTAPLSDGVDCH